MPVPIITVAQMREWEAATWAMGATAAEVIRRVGRAVGLRALRMTRPGDLILILAGKGNNGQDALSAQEHLVERRVEVLSVTEPESQSAALENSLAPRPRLV